MGVKIFYVSNGHKKNLGFKRSKSILCFKWV